MTCRIEGGITFKQDYNAENRISAIHKLALSEGEVMNGDCSTGTVTESWLYGYDGDGVRVSTAHYTGVTQDSLTLYYMGGAYEVTGTQVKKYYSMAGQTIMRDSDGSLKYLLTDHLGSTSAVTDQNGTLLSQQRYLPFGEVRSIPNSPVTQTDFGYTFQRNLSGTGLMDYRARFYSVSLGRFIQPDSIIPNALNPQAFNRFSYVGNRPINFTDPTGHVACTDDGEYCRQNTPVRLHSTLLLFSGDFTDEEMDQIEESTEDLANKMAYTINQFNDELCYKFGEECLADVTPEDAFLTVFGGPITFKKVKSSCADYLGNPEYNCWGSHVGNRTINVYTNADPEKIIGVFQFPVHEMFHAIDTATGYAARDFFALDVALMSQNGLDASGRWSQSGEDTSWEVFADTGIAWTYNHYDPTGSLYQPEDKSYNGTYSSYVSAVMNNFMQQFLWSTYYGLP